jgi:hypothetical protein
VCLCPGGPESVLSKCVLSAECIVAVANGSAGLAAERGDSTTQRESSSGESVQGKGGGGGASQNQKPHLDTPPVSPRPHLAIFNDWWRALEPALSASEHSLDARDLHTP